LRLNWRGSNEHAAQARPGNDYGASHAGCRRRSAGAHVDGSNWSQNFEAGGATVYTGADGKQSSGRWDVRGDEYCSQWPPSDVWACYAMAADTTADGITIIWINADGSRESARLIAKGQ
jgi:hypothetical protein